MAKKKIDFIDKKPFAGFFLLFIMAVFFSCSDDTNPTTNNIIEPAPATPVINYGVTKYYPHDSTLFTEGFLFHDNQLFESTGSPEDLPETKSLIGITDLATGKFNKKIEIDKSKYFGEGIVFFKDKLYQLTYKTQTGFIYDAKTFKKLSEFKFANKEGWSLTTDTTNLIMSDGTDNLTYLNPADLKPVKSLNVTENGSPRDNLNELEFIKGFIYANIWQTDFIVKIDPASGKVIGKLDLSSIDAEAKNKNPKADVLNGIAYDPVTDKIYVTGKLWTNIYEITFRH